jgi:hypothetical protein
LASRWWFLEIILGAVPDGMTLPETQRIVTTSYFRSSADNQALNASIRGPKIASLGRCYTSRFFYAD